MKKKNMNSSSELSKLIKIVIIVLVVCVLFYLLALLTENKGSETISTEIQYSEIIVGTLLNQNNDIYYVLAYDPDDLNYSTYSSYLSGINCKYYTLNLTSAFNIKYFTNEQNFEIESINDISFNKTTLLKIENNKISEHYTDDDILTKLNDLQNENA